MLRMKLPDWLNTCLSWVSWKLCGQIPTKIDGGERIMRTIFHPANINEKKGTLKSNFMRPQISHSDEDDSSIASNKLSVTRYDYSGMEFCRSHARANQSEPNRHYWGFGRFVVSALEETRMFGDIECGSIVEYKPTPDNPAHANIHLGYRIKPGETLRSEWSDYIKHLADSAEVYQDPNPTSPTWEGVPIDEPHFGILKYKQKS